MLREHRVEPPLLVSAIEHRLVAEGLGRGSIPFGKALQVIRKGVHGSAPVGAAVREAENVREHADNAPYRIGRHRCKVKETRHSGPDLCRFLLLGLPLGDPVFEVAKTSCRAVSRAL